MLLEFELGSGFLAMKPKAQAAKEEKDKLDFIKIKNFVLWRTSRKYKDNPEDFRKFLQIVYLIRNLYLEYIKDCYNSTLERQVPSLKNGQRI